MHKSPQAHKGDHIMDGQLNFVRNDLCWVRMNKKGRFYPARIVDDEDLNERQMWRGKRPLYSVIFFDKEDIYAGSAYHIRYFGNIKSWKVGLEAGLNRSVSVAVLDRALRFYKIVQDNKDEQEASLPERIGSSSKMPTESDASSYKYEWPLEGVHNANVKAHEETLKRTVITSKKPPNEILPKPVRKSKQENRGASSSVLLKKRRASSVSWNRRQSARMDSQAFEMRSKTIGIRSPRLALSKNGAIEEPTSSAHKRSRRARSQSHVIAQGNSTPMRVNIGWIGANNVGREVIRAMLRKADVRISAIWDQNFKECEMLVKHLSDESYDAIGPMFSMEDLCANSDVVFCCLEQKTLMHEEKDGTSGVELLLDKVLTAAGNAHVGVFIITFFSRALARAASLMLDDYAKQVPVVGVSVCGAVGRANVAFVSGNKHLYETYANTIRCLATNIIRKGDEPAKAILCGTLYNRFVMGLTFETFAWRAFAAEYGIRNSDLDELLNESDLLNDFVKLAVPAVLDERLRESMQPVVVSTAQARWVISAAMGTYAAASNSRAMVQTGLSIHQVLENSEASNFAEAFDEFFGRKM